jgi:hypothetical protein
MATDKELEQYAHDCIRLAGMTDDPSIREPWLKMARDWMEVARAEQQQEPQGIFTRSRNLRNLINGRTGLGRWRPPHENRSRTAGR